MAILATRVTDSLGNVFEFEPNSFGSVSVNVYHPTPSATKSTFNPQTDGYEPLVELVFAGTPIRFKVSGARIAADFPGVDSNIFVTDANGSITNG